MDETGMSLSFMPSLSLPPSLDWGELTGVPECVVKTSTTSSKSIFEVEAFDTCEIKQIIEPKSSWSNQFIPNGIHDSRFSSKPDHVVSFAQPSAVAAAATQEPKWLEHFHLLPAIYHQVIRATTTSHGLDSTLIYRIFLTSDLDMNILHHIWSVVNRTHPGWLTPTELILALALIGLAQQQQFDSKQSLNIRSIHTKLTIQQLCRLQHPPIPRLRPSSQQQTPPRPPPSPTANPFASNTFVPHGNTAELHRQANGSLPESAFKSQEDDDEWADFTSSASVAMATAVVIGSHPVTVNPLVTSASNIAPTIPMINTDPLTAHSPLAEMNPRFSSHTARVPTNAVSPPAPRPIDDEFGDFQTGGDVSSEKACNPQSTKLSTAAPTTDETVLEQVSLAKPNYNLSADFESYESPNEMLQHEWLRCLIQCAEVMQDALDALVVLASETERREFNINAEGHDFLLNLTEVCRIVQHIDRSAKKHGLLNAVLQTRLTQLRDLSQQHTPYFILPELQDANRPAPMTRETGLLNRLGINVNRLESEMSDAVARDARYWLENDTKIRAVEQRVPSYEHFRQLVAGCHLRPLNKSELIGSNGRSTGWNLPGISNTPSVSGGGSIETQLGIPNPTTPQKFYSTWQQIKKQENVNQTERTHQLASLLLTRDAQFLQNLFDTGLGVSLLSDLLSTLNAVWSQPDMESSGDSESATSEPDLGPVILGVMQCFGKSDQFSIAVQFMSDEELKLALNLLNRIEQNSSGEMVTSVDELRRKFTL